MVALADLVAHATGAGTPGGPSLSAAERTRVYRDWRLGEEDLMQVSGAMATEIEKARVFLEIAARA